jgi:hypothetical protein
MAEDLQKIISPEEEPADLAGMTASITYLITIFISSSLIGYIAVHVFGTIETASP